MQSRALPGPAAVASESAMRGRGGIGGWVNGEGRLPEEERDRYAPTVPTMVQSNTDSIEGHRLRLAGRASHEEKLIKSWLRRRVSC